MYRPYFPPFLRPYFIRAFVLLEIKLMTLKLHIAQSYRQKHGLTVNGPKLSYGGPPI